MRPSRFASVPIPPRRNRGGSRWRDFRVVVPESSPAFDAAVRQANAAIEAGRCPEDGEELVAGACACGFRILKADRVAWVGELDLERIFGEGISVETVDGNE